MGGALDGGALVGGGLDCFSGSSGESRYKLWSGVTKLNDFHGTFFWLSLFTVGFADAEGDHVLPFHFRDELEEVADAAFRQRRHMARHPIFWVDAHGEEVVRLGRDVEP